MLYKKQKNILLFLDIIEVLLSIVALILFTLIFRLDTSNVRYLFLLGDIYVIFSFPKAWSSLEIKVQKRVLKNSKSKIEGKYLKKLST